MGLSGISKAILQCKTQNFAINIGSGLFMALTWRHLDMITLVQWGQLVTKLSVC